VGLNVPATDPACARALCTTAAPWQRSPAAARGVRARASLRAMMHGVRDLPCDPCGCCAGILPAIHSPSVNRFMPIAGSAEGLTGRGRGFDHGTSAGITESPRVWVRRRTTAPWAHAMQVGDAASSRRLDNGVLAPRSHARLLCHGHPRRHRAIFGRRARHSRHLRHSPRLDLGKGCGRGLITAFDGDRRSGLPM
jgi:hypothetical protein